MIRRYGRTVESKGVEICVSGLGIDNPRDRDWRSESSPRLLDAFAP